MRKIVEYKVIFALDRQFTTRVNEHIQEGWQPFGGVSSDANNGYFSQAMVKYEEEPEVTVNISDEAVRMAFKDNVQTPEQKFKAKRWEYYRQFEIDRGFDRLPDFDVPAVGILSWQQLQDVINQEYNDYIDGVSEQASGSM